MNPPDEHADDLEPEVAEGAAVETEQYEQEDQEEVVPGADVTNRSESSTESGTQSDLDDESEDEASDTI
jgi:hypothetical protein